MWSDPMDELIADLEGIAETTPPRFNDIPPVDDLQYWAARILRTTDVAQLEGKGPSDVDPTFEEDYAEFRAKWPRWYKLDTSAKT